MRTLSFAPSHRIPFHLVRTCAPSHHRHRRAIGVFHHEHRAWAIFSCGLSASTAAFVNFYLFVPTLPLQPFIPSPAHQTAVSLIFAAGLFIGISSRSTCESLASS